MSYFNEHVRLRWVQQIRVRLAVFVILAPVIAHAMPPVQLPGLPVHSLAPMLERVTPGVVNISTRTRIEHEDHPLLRDPVFRWFFDIPKRSERVENSLGSGVIVNAQQGFILTNHHVVDKADEISVTLHDGRQLEASLKGSDPETDIALLQVAPQGLSAIAVGDSDRLRVGDFVVAIGNPFGLNKTVTSGIVSALGRTGLGIEGYESFIQTDASINPGNSGGPLVNLNGELVGINTAILAPSGGNVGIGFAIPINMARAVMAQLVEYGEVRRGHFGVESQDLTPELAQALGLNRRKGAVVVRVEDGSPAHKSGLQAGDVIVNINGIQLKGAADLRNRVGLMRIGSNATMDVLRSDKPLRVTLQIADPFASYLPGDQFHPYFSGAILANIVDTSELGKLAAVHVGRVKQNSNAKRLGLRKGDVILELNDERIENLSDLGEVARRARQGFMLYIRRGEQVVRLTIRF